MDWVEYRNEILGRIGELGKLSPDTLKGYQTLSGAGAKTGRLSALGAPRPAPLHHRAQQAQMVKGLYFQLDEPGGSGQRKRKTLLNGFFDENVNSAEMFINQRF